MTRPTTKPRASRSGPSGAHVSPRIKVSVDPERRAAWARAAKKAGLSLVAWVRWSADRIAGYHPVETDRPGRRVTGST